MHQKTTRRNDIDMAKGLAILLVVLGHLVARADPASVYWYEPLRRAIYSFHMPFFLYLSGMVAVLSGSLFCQPNAWPALAVSRAKRLMLPFFAVGILIVLGKYAAKSLVFIDNEPTGLLAGLVNLFWRTADSPALSIWYLFVLFVLSLSIPFFLQGQGSRLPLMLIATLTLYIVPLPPYIYLDHIGRYAVFFSMGACAGMADTGWTKFIDRFWLVCLSAFLFLLISIAIFGASWSVQITLLLAGILSMPALHGLVRHLSFTLAAPLFLMLGHYAFSIYLFNTIFIGLAKGLLLRFVSWDGPHFLPFACALMVAGTLGPISLRQVFLRFTH